MVTAYVGHGIGRTMHENPQVPNYVDRETRKADFRLEPGLTLAVEPMVNMRRGDVDTLGDTVDRGDPRPDAERPRRAHAGPDRAGRGDHHRRRGGVRGVRTRIEATGAAVSAQTENPLPMAVDRS